MHGKSENEKPCSTGAALISDSDTTRATIALNGTVDIIILKQTS